MHDLQFVLCVSVAAVGTCCVGVGFQPYARALEGRHRFVAVFGLISSVSVCHVGVKPGFKLRHYVMAQA